MIIQSNVIFLGDLVLERLTFIQKLYESLDFILIVELRRFSNGSKFESFSESLEDWSFTSNRFMIFTFLTQYQIRWYSKEYDGSQNYDTYQTSCGYAQNERKFQQRKSNHFCLD